MREADQPQSKASNQSFLKLSTFQCHGLSQIQGTNPIAILGSCIPQSLPQMVTLYHCLPQFSNLELWKSASITSILEVHLLIHFNQRNSRSLRIRRHQAPREVQSMELLSPAEVRHVHRAVRAKALDAISVGNLPPGRELEAWILRSFLCHLFLSNRFEHVQVCATRVALCLQE